MLLAEMSNYIEDSIFKTNVLIVGESNSGKTTFLKKAIDEALKSEYCVLVFDSVTEHADKSIVVYCKNKFHDYVEIQSPDKSQITDRKTYTDEYPYLIIKNNADKQLYLFDVAKYLEEGYLYKDLQQRNDCRLLYKLFVNQCLNVASNVISERKTIVFMDEIEMIPQIADTIKAYNRKNIYFVDCLHNTDSCSSEVINAFKLYRLNQTK